MKYNLKKDIEYVKAILNINDDGISEFFNISPMTLNRRINGSNLPENESLEKIYDKIYKNNIDLNKIKEEMYNSRLKENHILLFHGAKTEIIGDPSISFSGNKKDFGKGFYLGESFNQSASFVSIYDNSSIYIFDFNKRNVKIKEFIVSKDWMILIAYFRGELSEYAKSDYIKKLLNELNNVDVVVAPIADNTMYTILDDFIKGKITDLQCINALSANRLGKQYVFLNDKIIKKNLKVLERCYFSETEKEYYEMCRLKENLIGHNKVILALREYAGKGKYIEELF